MRFTIILSVFSFLSIFSEINSNFLREMKSSTHSKMIIEEHPLFEDFEQWMFDFKIRIPSIEYFQSTFQKWIDNDEYIEKINSLYLDYSLGHNQFSGMDSKDYSEFLRLSNLMNTTKTFENRILYNTNTTLDVNTLPLEVNWVYSGAVTPVKDQGQCGSCWSFSTTGALEGAYYIMYDKLVSFSEQQLVDCDNLKNDGRDHGCNGGLMDNAFSWIQKNGGLCSESDYPYVSGNTQKSSTCQKSCVNVPYSIVDGYMDVPPANYNAMQSVLTQQPISIAIEADQRDFQLYSSGVFTGKCGTNLDHGVLLVGYGTQQGNDYYLVKNSWSTSWGEEGYIKLGRGPQYNNGQGQCGLLLEGSFPVLME